MIAIYDFGFLIGNWHVLNRRLKERLNNCNDWIEFEATMETKSILNGLGIMDEMKTSYFGDEFIGLSIRMLDPKSNVWTIYWADTFNPKIGLKQQVVGKFENGVGTFFGKEIFKGQKVELRFIWTKPSANTAQWEQAYYDKNNDQWETNWTMLFTSTLK
ncbi:hypothetical protein [Aureisphaera sp.]